MDGMTSHVTSLEAINVGLASAKQRVEEALDALVRSQEEYGKAVKELRWWEEGARMFGLVETQSLADAEAYLQELIPDGAVPEKPTLRQAMFFMLRANPHDMWTVSEIAGMLKLNNWLPREYQKRIADMAGAMVKDGQMEHVERGKYRLREDWAEALSRHLPASTDYRQAAVQQLPAPDQPAAHAGLADP
jgi:hypothetical protein